jgi:hypothetical protein
MGNYREYRGAIEHGGGRSGEREPGVPGRRTLSEELPPVQLRAAGPPAMDGATLQETAADGVAGDAGAQLPFHSIVQQSFGPDHDVSAIRAHVGGRGGDAARQIGAEAYATGNHVAFAGAPDLHTAAHEAAHVIQQQAGVQLKGGVGEQGDSYEREADAVADAVVAGRSAAPLLAKYAGASGRSTAVQMKTKTKTTKKKAKAPEITEAELLELSGQLVKIVSNRKDTAPTNKYAMGLLHLEWAMIANGPIAYSAESRLIHLDVAMAMLRPVFKAMRADQRWLWWLHTAGIEGEIAKVRRELNEEKAADRVAALSLGGSSDVTGGAKSEGKELQSAIKLHIKTTAKLTDLANDIVSEVKGDDKAKKDLVKATKDSLGLEVVNDTLGAVSAYLDLTDEEFQEKQSKINGLPGMSKAKTRLEMVKTVGELLESGIGATSKVARAIALHLGKTDLAAKLHKVAGSEFLGNAMAVVTLVHSATVLLDERSTDQERLDAVVDSSTAVLGLAGMATAGIVLSATYALAKLAASWYWEARSALTTTFTGAAFKTMTVEGGSLVLMLERLVITGGLLAAEQDPDQRTALEAKEMARAEELGGQVDDFLEQATQVKWERQPGGPASMGRSSSHRTLREIFSPLTKLKGKTAPEEVLEAATTLVNTIADVLKKADVIFRAELEGGGTEKLGEIEQEDTIAKQREEEDAERRKQELIDKWTGDVCDATPAKE